MKTVFSIMVASALACLAAACDFDNSESKKFSITRMQNPCSAVELAYEGDKIITATESFGQHVSQVINFFYVHGLLTSVRMATDNGSHYEVTLTYSDDRRLIREIHAAEYKSVDVSGNATSYRQVKTTDFRYDERGNIITTLSHQSDDHSGTGRIIGRVGDHQLKGDEIIDRVDYTWTRGNVVKESKRTCDENGSCDYAVQEAVYTYDNKRNYTNQDLAFRYINNLSVAFAFSRNNVSEVTSDFNGQLQQHYGYEFHYNKHGYPTDINVVSDGSESNPITLDYR